MIGSLGLTYVLLDASLRMKDEHFILKIGMFLTGTWLAVLTSGLSAELARFNTASSTLTGILDTFYTVLLWTAISATVYFILWVLKKEWEVLRSLILSVLGKEKKGGEDG